MNLSVFSDSTRLIILADRSNGLNYSVGCVSVCLCVQRWCIAAKHLNLSSCFLVWGQMWSGSAHRKEDLSRSEMLRPQKIFGSRYATVGHRYHSCCRALVDNFSRGPGHHHGRKWRGTGDESRRNWSGGCYCKLSLRFCHVSKFHAPDWLHNAVKAYQPHNSSRVFTTSQKYIFNVHHVTSSGGKFNIFLARTRTKSTTKNAPKHAISSEKFNFVCGGGIGPPQTPSPVERYPLPTPNP